MSKVALLLLTVAVAYVSCDRVHHLPSGDGLQEAKRSGLFKPYVEKTGYDILRYRREAGPEEIMAMDALVLEAANPHVEQVRRKRDTQHQILEMEEGEMLPIV